jgi:hypothetical protein
MLSFAFSVYHTLAPPPTMEMASTTKMRKAVFSMDRRLEGRRWKRAVSDSPARASMASEIRRVAAREQPAVGGG